MALANLNLQMVYQVLMTPEYLEPMREEIRNAVDTHGWTDKALINMPLVDSFLRETNRLYPNGAGTALFSILVFLGPPEPNLICNAVTAARTVMEKPFTFHDGLTLPVGSRIAFPSRAIMVDPDNFDDPYSFRGFRFAELAAAKESAGGKLDNSKEQQFSASTVTKTNLA
jgi:cytochrome P450